MIEQRLISENSLNSITLLQNLVNKDPQSYYEEFIQQYSHFESLKNIFSASCLSEEQCEFFGQIIFFLSSVCKHFSKETADFPEILQKILINNHTSLTPSLREKIIQCLSILRNKNVLSSESLIQTLFPLLLIYSGSSYVGSEHAKSTRSKIFTTLISVLKNENSKSKNQKLNRSTQALFFSLLDSKDINGLWVVKIVRELWRRGVWDDSRTVELMIQATLHPELKISILAISFFLNLDKEKTNTLKSQEIDEESDFDIGFIRHKMSVNKKTSKRNENYKKFLKMMKKRKSKKNDIQLNFSAIHLLRDPQGFSEKLFDKYLDGHVKQRLDLKHKILIMTLLSRLIGVHKLSINGIYTYFLRYLTLKQRNVTQILVAVVQSTHDLVPVDLITTLIRKISDEFISDGVKEEAAALGLNTIREILIRCPSAINETLLTDLVEYKKSKSKIVFSAARSLITLFRNIAPELLKKKDRGKAAYLKQKQKNQLLGSQEENSIFTSIPGIDLLVKWKKNEDESNELTSDESNIEIEDNDLKSLVDIDTENTNLENKTDRQKKLENFLSSTILTEKDFKKLKEIQLETGLNEFIGSKTANENEIPSESLESNTKRKLLREEKILWAKKDKTDQKYGPNRDKKNKTSSTTNKEKSKAKNYLMMINKKSIKGKQKVSLRDKQKILRAHVTRQKKNKKKH